MAKFSRAELREQVERLSVQLVTITRERDTAAHMNRTAQGEAQRVIGDLMRAGHPDCAERVTAILRELQGAERGEG